MNEPKKTPESPASIPEHSLAQVLANNAIAGAVRNAEELHLALGGDMTGLPEATRIATERLVTQDRAIFSWRVWGGIWSAITAVLVIPEVQVAVHAIVGQAVPAAYLPVATAVLGAIWPMVSKARDGRPVRGATP